MSLPAGFDPRLTPARPDLAAAHLEGTVKAARFVEGAAKRVAWSTAPLRRHPAPDAPLETEALHGEPVTVYETTEEGWAWCQLDTDGYVGWLPSAALAEPGSPPTHKVIALRTLVFPGPSIKLPPVDALPLGAQLEVASIDGPLAVSATGGHLPASHLARLDAREPDFVAVAERFLGTPYLWGGKTSLGLDCSALVQVALAACGVTCPRDSDLQETALGRAIEPADDLSNLQRGDLLFWKGHVAIVRDRTALLHANAHHMAVAVEPLRDAITRIRTAGDALRTVKRMEAGT